MMRYHRVSPDCVPLRNGINSNLKTDGAGENGRVPYSNDSSCRTNSLQVRGSSRFISPSTCPRSENDHHSHNNPSGDVLFQWGQNKRSRGLRTNELRSITDESSSSSSSTQANQGLKIHLAQSSPGVAVEKLSISTIAQMASMLPPPLPPPAASNGRLRSCTPNTKEKDSSASLPTRNLVEGSGAGNGPSSGNSGRVASRSKAGKDSSHFTEKKDSKRHRSGLARDERPNGSLVQAEYMSHIRSAVTTQSEQGVEADNPTDSMVGTERGSIEWPRIYPTLSRKEKEDDFLAIKGTKLPHRPKKRAKNIDRTLQYCYPGMWLSDLTKSRYEVREKKCVKKQKQKRRGLKGMENMDSDSE